MMLGSLQMCSRALLLGSVLILSCLAHGHRMLRPLFSTQINSPNGDLHMYHHSSSDYRRLTKRSVAQSDHEDVAEDVFGRSAVIEADESRRIYAISIPRLYQVSTRRAFSILYSCKLLLLLLIKKVGSARLRVIYTLSVRRPKPHNTNLQTERREREKDQKTIVRIEQLRPIKKHWPCS